MTLCTEIEVLGFNLYNHVTAQCFYVQELNCLVLFSDMPRSSN